MAQPHRRVPVYDNTGIFEIKAGRRPSKVQITHPRHAFYGKTGEVCEISRRRNRTYVRVRVYLPELGRHIRTWANHRSVQVLPE